MCAAVAAADLAFTTAGAGAVYTGHPLERCFRDLHTANQHIAFSGESFRSYARHRFGRTQDSFVVLSYWVKAFVALATAIGQSAPIPRGHRIMRAFKLQVQTSVDGYMAGPNGEMDWLSTSWTDDVGAYINVLTESVDCIVLGRKLAEGFIPHWAARPDYEPDTAIDMRNNTPTIVISNTLVASPWENTVVASGDVVQTIKELKAQPGGDIIAYGGGTLVAALIDNELIDEIHLFVNPIAIGSGMPVFGHPDTYRRFRLVGAQPFDCGIGALHYAPQGS
jgi:dihydrofolate reductase